MRQRCPGAEVFGTSTILGYRMLFKQSMTGAYATIEQDANSCVPVVIYRMTAADERGSTGLRAIPSITTSGSFSCPCGTERPEAQKAPETASPTSCMNTDLGEPSRIISILLDRWI
jgi:hypothetical protein